MQNDDKEFLPLENVEIGKIINDKKHHYHLKNIYYSFDGQNIFKRVDRYRHKLFLIIVFSFLIFINFHEIIFNIIILVKDVSPENLEKKSKSIFGQKDDYYYWNIASEYLCDIYIIALLLLSFYTFAKFGIETQIYY